MLLFLFSLISAALAALSSIPEINWLCLLGFGLAISVWVAARKMIQTKANYPLVRVSMVIGIMSTFLNLAAILFFFILTTLFFGGSVVF